MLINYTRAFRCFALPISNLGQASNDLSCYPYNFPINIWKLPTKPSPSPDARIPYAAGNVRKCLSVQPWMGWMQIWRNVAWNITDFLCSWNVVVHSLVLQKFPTIMLLYRAKDVLNRDAKMIMENKNSHQTMDDQKKFPTLIIVAWNIRLIFPLLDQ